MKRRSAMVFGAVGGASALAVACGLDLTGVASVRSESDAGGDVSRPPPTTTTEPEAGVEPRCDGGLCPPEVVLALPATELVRAVTVDGPFLYYVNATSKKVFRVNAADGSEPREMVSEEVRQLAVRGDVLFYTYPQGIRRMTLTTHDAVGGGEGVVGCLDIDKDGSFVYVADFAKNRIMRLPFAAGGTAAALFESEDGVQRPWGVAVTATDVFFTLSGGPPGELRRRPLTPSTTPPLTLARDRENPNCMVIDEAGRVYWPNNRSGTLERIDADGRNVVTLAAGQGKGDGATFTQLGIDARFIYWSADNEIRRLAR
ncbi:MAG: hypothetical protein KIT84_19975 [Labilithrix sp.]|nr:hypothetical protein [Labilithrix sp.]MCW5813317.1 hypothetical protein [Labilithrix sp.]